MNKNLSAQGGPARGGKITSITIILVVIGITGWFLVGKKLQNNMDTKSENQQQGENIVKNEERDKLPEKQKEEISNKEKSNLFDAFMHYLESNDKEIVDT